jgi:hypothetical protein
MGLRASRATTPPGAQTPRHSRDIHSNKDRRKDDSPTPTLSLFLCVSRLKASVTPVESAWELGCEGSGQIIQTHQPCPDALGMQYTPSMHDTDGQIETGPWDTGPAPAIASSLCPGCPVRACTRHLAVDSRSGTSNWVRGCDARTKGDEGDANVPRMGSAGLESVSNRATSMWAGVWPPLHRQSSRPSS